MTAKNKEVAPKKNTAMAMYEGMDDSDGGGFEHADADSFSVPFVKLLQKLSKQCDEDAEEYIKGAKQGMYFNTVTEEVFPDGVRVIPCHYERVFIEWVPRDSGGGLVNVHPADTGADLLSSCKRDDKNRDILPNGNELQDTRVHYVLVQEKDGEWSPAIISLARTQTKSSRDWMSKMKRWKLPNGNGAAMFAQVWKLSSKKKTKDDNTWAVVVPEPVGLVFDVFKDGYASLVADAKEFRKMITSGQARVDHANAVETESDQEEM